MRLEPRHWSFTKVTVVSLQRKTSQQERSRKKALQFLSLIRSFSAMDLWFGAAEEKRILGTDRNIGRKRIKPNSLTAHVFPALDAGGRHANWRIVAGD